MVRTSDFVLSWKDIDADDQHHVGHHAAKIGSLSNHFSFPHGFVVSSNAYFHFLDKNSLNTKIAHLLNSINFERDESVGQVSNHIKNLICTATIPSEIAQKIIREYEKINSPAVYLKSHLISGDPDQKLPQYGDFDHIEGDAALLNAIRYLWAHIYRPELIKYRQGKNIDHLKTGIATSVHRKINSDLKGKIWTNDPLNILGNSIIVEIEYAPHQFVIDRNNFSLKYRKHEHSIPVVYVRDGFAFENKLNTQQILTLANLGLNYEKMHYFPHVIDWVIENGTIYIVDSKPLTAHGKN